MGLNDKNIAALEKFKAFLGDYKTVVPAMLQEQAVQELKLIEQAHKQGLQFDKLGEPQPIGASGAAWLRKKAARHWSLTPGIATGVLLEVAARPSVVRKTKYGYNWRKLEQVSARVKHYAAFFQRSKAPGYMNMKAGYQQRHRERVDAGIAAAFQAELGSAGRVARKSGKHQIKLKLETIYSGFKLTRLRLADYV